ncbi:MAG: protein kinase domain-containing protein [Limisphaerales bacterium]
MDGNLDPALDREREIFLAALDRPSAGERAAFLDGACGNDVRLRARLQSLLRHYSEDRFLEDPVADLKGMPRSEPSVDEGIGAVIGRYKLLQKIGEGGMGVVYMAQQEEPVRRRVALKIIKLGMDTKQVVARFEAERQALALMDHPNIAKVLDGGATDTGRPYFVMELVQGVPITEFCDRNRLPARERIKLFITVCQAIQSAHQKGIIHRDLKPTNILVTLDGGVPMPMVIDFGVAKATQQKLTEKTVFTNYATMIGTPAYMSPEQAEMSRLDVDTRSDIYGLGVLLYELLTGTTPFPEQRLRSAGYREMQRIILEEEPERPSTRLSTLQGEQRSLVARNRGASELALGRVFADDLDWIVMKCLEKDRARRYETANGLAADLRRHLNNEPVVARPPSTVYRLQKAWRRHKLGFTAAVAVVGALVVGTGVSTWQAIVASTARNAENQQRFAAQTERDKAQAAQKEAQQARLEAEHQLYAAKMNLAQQAWEQNNIGQLRQLLNDTQDSADRGFEWYYWQRQTHLSLKTLRGHLSGVTSVAFSPDGRRIVTGSFDNTAKMWDAASGEELLTLKGHSGEVRSVAFSPDGQRIVTGSADKTARVWEAANGRELLTLKGHNDQVFSVAFSPDGQRIATGSYDYTAKVWEAASGHELLTLTGHSNFVLSGAFSPDGQRIVTGSADQTAMVWETASGRKLLTLAGHSDWIKSGAFSPDGQRIVTGSSDQTAKVWDAANGNSLFTLTGHNDQVFSVAFSPDSKRIVTGSNDQTARVWEAANGRELLTLKGHNSGIYSVAFSPPDGQQIVTGSDDGTAKVWDAANGQETLTLRGHSNDIFSVAFSPDGQRILSGSWDGTAKVWEAASSKELLTLTGHSIEIASAALSPYPKGHVARVFSAAFSPDGRQIVTGSSDGTAEVWDAASGRELFPLKGHSEWIISVAFSPDGQRIVTGSVDKTAKVWKAASGMELVTLKGHSDGINSAAFSPDGQRIVTGSADKTARVWDATTGEALLTLKGHGDEIWSVAFSPTGQRIVTGSFDNTAKMWDAANGQEILTLRGHRHWVLSVAFSPDGQRIVTGSDDHTAKVWEAATGRELLTLKGHSSGVTSAAFSLDGQRIVTGSRDKTARVWQAARPEEVAAWQAEDERAKTYDQFKQASALAGDGKLADAEQLLTRLLTETNDSAALTVQILTLRGNILARSGQWQEAAADLSRAIEYNPSDHLLWLCLAGIHVQRDQLDAYRELCRKGLERFGGTTDPYTADQIAKGCLILPGSGVSLDTVATMADTAVTGGRHSEFFPYFQFCKGLAEYRQGRFASAADWMGTVLTNRVDSLPPDTGAYVVTGAYMVLAMAQYQLQHIEPARASLAKGAELEHKLPQLGSGDLGNGWIDCIIAHALMREAKALGPRAMNE